MRYGETLLLEAVRRAHDQRLHDIARKWRLYNGEHEKPLKIRPAKNGRPPIDDNVTPNLVGLFVDKGVSFLMGEPPSFVLPKDGNTGGGDAGTASEGDVQVSPEEEHLDRVWKISRKKTLCQELALNGGIAGHAFLRIVVPDAGAVTDAQGKPLPYLRVLDSANVDVAFDQDDYKIVQAYKLEWLILDQATGRPAVRRQIHEAADPVVGPWTITDYIARGDKGEHLAFEQMGEAIQWPYPFPQIVDAQNLVVPNEYFGRGDLDGGLDALNASINRVLSNLARVVRFHGHPKTWASGITTQALKDVVVDPDGVIGLPHPEAQLHNLEMVSSVESIIAAFDKLKGLLHEIGRVPYLDPEKLEGVGTMSGLALKILYGPLLELTEQKRGTYGDLLEETNRRLLAIAGLAEYDPGMEVHVEWADPIPNDPATEATMYESWQRLGFSKHTIIEKLGGDPEVEKERRADEAQADMEQMQAAFDKGQLGGDAYGGNSTGGNQPPNDRGNQ